MSNSYTTTTHQSWGSRIKGSFAQAVIGIMLFFAAFPMLFLNEGRSVHRAQALEEGEKIVTPIKANNILKNNEDMLVHTSGEATTDEVLTDIMLGLEAPKVIKLQRVVEMYQWEETEHSETEAELGGGSTTTTTYTYSKVWSENIIDSNRFAQAATYSNPSDMPIRGETFLAQQIKLGEFTLSDSIVSQINQYHNLPIDGKTREQVLEKISYQFGKSHFQGEYFTVAENPSRIQIGDLRIKFEVVPSTMISVVAKQVGSRLATYTTVGGEPLLLFEYGMMDAKEMFESAKRDNIILTWGLRLAGFLMMGIGLSMILNVLAILAAVVPILGRIVGGAGATISFIIAIPFTLITIAIAWLFYRPLLSLILFLIAGVILSFLIFWRRKQQTVVSQQPVFIPQQQVPQQQVFVPQQVPQQQVFVPQQVLQQQVVVPQQPVQQVLQQPVFVPQQVPQQPVFVPQQVPQQPVPQQVIPQQPVIVPQAALPQQLMGILPSALQQTTAPQPINFLKF